jgi:hypothetical protein
VRIVKNSLHGGDGLSQLLLNKFLHESPKEPAGSLPRFVILLCDFIAGVLLPDELRPPFFMRREARDTI